MADISTANVIGVYSGTNFNISVTAANLDNDLSIKDFIVLQNNVLVPNTSYVKTTRTVLTYVGASLPVGTVIEVRRKTPTAPVQEVTYATRFSSALWNAEVERTARWKAEVEVNGAGLSGIGLPVPKDDPYGVLWASDTVYPPTRKSVYNQIQAMPTLASAAFTGSPTVPNLGAVESTSKVPNTKYLSDFYAPLANPNLTGNVSVPTRTQGDSSTGAASTAWVLGELTRYRITTANGIVFGINANSFTTIQSSGAALVVPTGYSNVVIHFQANGFWSVNDPVSHFVYYQLEISTNGGGFGRITSSVQPLPANFQTNYFTGTFFSVYPVTPGQSYVFRVTFTYAGGTGTSKTYTLGEGSLAVILVRNLI